MNDPWPFPADTPLERARTIARYYRAKLLDTNPAACDEIDQLATQRGQTWVMPIESDVLDIDELLTAEQISDLIHVHPRTIRMWGYRGHIERLGDDGKPLYRFRDILDYQATQRRRRQASVTNRPRHM